MFGGPTGTGRARFAAPGQGQAERTKKNSLLFLDSVLGVSAEKATNYRGYVRDNTGALVGMRNPEGSPVAMKRYYYLRDALGSVVALTNDQGTVVRRHVYEDPYGEVVSNDTIVTGAPSNPYRFAGEYFDTETGLSKIGERYYDPALARWTQKDPMMQAFSPREANGYTYAGGDPVNLTDPDGTHIFGDVWDDTTDAVSDAWGSTAGVRSEAGDLASAAYDVATEFTTRAITSWKNPVVRCTAGAIIGARIAGGYGAAAGCVGGVVLR